MNYLNHNYVNASIVKKMWFFPAIANRIKQKYNSKCLPMECTILKRSIYHRFLKRVSVDTFVLLRCYYAFVLPIFEYCSLVWESAAECHLQFWCARCIRCPGFTLISLSCRCVIDSMLLHCVCCTRFIRPWIIVCSVIFHLFLPEFDILELRLQLIH